MYINMNGTNTNKVSKNELTKNALQNKEIVGFQQTNTPGIMLETYLTEKIPIKGVTINKQSASTGLTESKMVRPIIISAI